jgi:hypothetical protein
MEALPKWTEAVGSDVKNLWEKKSRGEGGGEGGGEGDGEGEGEGEGGGEI